MLFTSFKYHISSSFPSSRIEELKHVLDANGACEVAGGEGWLKEVNLVVTNSMKFEGWEEVRERNERRKLGGEEEAEEEVYVVTDKWVDRSLVFAKTQSPYHYSPDPALIFSGVVACATVLPPSDLEVLSAGITALGGQWRTGLTKDVTHLFAMSPDSQKYATALHFRAETGIKIVLPHWFDDVVRLGMGGLSTDVYEWPDPQLLRNPLGVGGLGGLGGPELNGVKKNMYAMAALFTSPMHGSSPPPLDDLETAAVTRSRIEADVWKGKKMILSRTLQLFDRRREAVQVGIERAGGVVVRYDGDEEVDEGFGILDGPEELSKREKERRKNEADKVLESDVLVTRWRDGAAYIAALRSHKTIGTLAWLFHVQSTGTLTRPVDQLLHYPVPKRPIEAFSNHVITLTNYTGEAREYLKKLIIAMGAKFTPSMSGQNTVLIAAYISGTKAAKAQSWSIPVVNHTWLEDCFIQWRNLTVGLEKYIGFPNGVDFSRLLGVRGVGGVVEALDVEVDGAEGGDGPHGSVEEVQGLVDVDMAGPEVRQEEDPVASRISPKKTVLEDDDDPVDEEEETTGRQKRKTRNRVSSPEPDEEEKSTRIQKQKTPAKNNMLSSDNESDEDIPSHIVKTSSKAKKGKEKQEQPRSKKATTVVDDDDSEVEAVSSRVAKTDLNAKGKGKAKVAARSNKFKEAEDMEEEGEEPVETNKTIKVQPRSIRSNAKSRGRDDDEEEEEEGEKEEEEERPKPNRVVNAENKRKFADDDDDDDEEQEDEAEDLKSNSRPKPKTKTNSRGRKPTAVESEDELSIGIHRTPTPPPRTRNTKLVRRVSGVVPEVDLDVHLQDEAAKDKEREEKPKPRLSLIEKSQAKKGDARTRIRKRKASSVVDIETDEDEGEQEEEPVVVVKSSSLKGKTKKAKAESKGKGKLRDHVLPPNSEEEDEEEEDKPREQLSKMKTNKKKSIKSISTHSSKAKSTAKSAKSKYTSISDNDDDADEEELEQVEQPSDSDGDLPAALFINRNNNGKRVSAAGVSTPKKSISASAVKLKGRKGAVESEDEDEGGGGHVVFTPKRALSVLMPSFNLSGDKKKGSAGVKKVGKGGKGKQVKLSAEDDEEPDALVSLSSRAVTRTESIRVMSNHQVQLSTKSPGAGGSTSAAVKKNRTTVTSSKSASKSKTVPMDVDSPSPSPPPRTTTKAKPSPKTKPPSPVLKRSAAAKATQLLHNTIMPDLVHFESQMKRANAKGGRKSGGGLIAFKVEGEDKVGSGSGGKRGQVGDGDEDEERVKKRQRVDDDVGGSVIVVSAKGKGKRKVQEEEEGEEEEEVGAKKRSSTKGKGKTVVIVASEEEEEDHEVVISSSKGGAKMKNKGKEVEKQHERDVILLTTQVTLGEDVMRSLTKLGVKFTSRPSECTHLLAPQLVRTEKFLCALVVAPFILTEKWAVKSAAVKKLLPEKDFALHDSAGENKYGIDLMQSLRRAKELGGKLLAGQTFYVTPKVPVDVKLLKNVVNACGGQVTTQQPTLRIITTSPENRHVISCKEDIAIWRPMAAQGIPIYSQELLLTGALKQEIDWDGDDVRVDI